MIIRKQMHEDIDKLELLFQLVRVKTFFTRPKNDFQIGDYQKSTEGENVWVAEENGMIVGFVSIYPANNFVHNLFIHPNYQGKSIGSQLLQIAELNLNTPMTLKIAIDNLTVCRFYEKHGWHQISVHDDTQEPYVLYGKS